MTQFNCEFCGRERHRFAYACKPCKKLIDREDMRGKPNKTARKIALAASWDGTVYRCYYSNWPLTLDDSNSPFYFTWDHRTPGCEDDIVVAAALINDMKSDLTDAEFRELIVNLARHFSDNNAEVPVCSPKLWSRRSSSRIATPPHDHFGQSAT